MAKVTPLNIKDSDAYRAARELADRTGETLTTTVRVALQERLERVRRQSPDPLLVERLMEIARHCSELPVIDNRTADEIVGYDEHGIPT